MRLILHLLLVIVFLSLGCSPPGDEPVEDAGDGEDVEVGDVDKGGDGEEVGEDLEDWDVPWEDPEHCFDGVVSGNESDVDCGGTSCEPCEVGQRCNRSFDCRTGNCDMEEGVCVEPECPNNCYYRGRCVDGVCMCEPGYGGEDCGGLSCPNDCSGQGGCDDGVCRCDEGFTGPDCSVEGAGQGCLNDCSGRGVCEGGVCRCPAGYGGVDCSQELGGGACPNHCSGNGVCDNGTCICQQGYRGVDCSESSCLNDCFSNGTCYGGICDCNPGWTGPDCSAPE